MGVSQSRDTAGLIGPLFRRRPSRRLQMQVRCKCVHKVAQRKSGSVFLAGRWSEWRPTGVMHSVLRAPWRAAMMPASRDAHAC
jgi:hypothetical protein